MELEGIQQKDNNENPQVIGGFTKYCSRNRMKTIGEILKEEKS